MKKFFCHPALFQSVLISVDQLTESEGEDSFTIDPRRLCTAILCADSYAAHQFLGSLRRVGWKASLIQVFADRNRTNQRLYSHPRLVPA